MDIPFVHLAAVEDAVQIAPNSIVSRPLHADDKVKVVLFGFDAGQELSEHTASVPAILHILRGEAEIALGEDIHQATAGDWTWMPPQLPHSIRARTPVVMLLTMLK